MPAVLGVARGTPFVETLQPGHSLAPDLDRQLYDVHLLVVAATDWLCAHHGAHHAVHQPAVPVLDPYRACAPHGAAGVGAEHAVTPPRPSRIEPALSRPQPRRRAHHLGPSFWHV